VAAITAPRKPAFRGVSHHVAAIVFPVMGVLLVALGRTAGVRWALVVYTLGLTAMYATSACLHRGHWSSVVEARIRRLDHSMILVAIAATYTPVAIAALPARTAAILLAIVWGLASVGVAMRLFWRRAPRAATVAVYLAVGWTAVAFMPALWHGLGVVPFALVVLGGVVYSIGAIVYATRRPDPAPLRFGFHEVFHALVIAAGLLFYAAIAQLVVTR